MVLRILSVIFLLLSLFPVAGLAADSTDSNSSAVVEVAVPAALPGFSELGVRSATLADFVAKSMELLVGYSDTTKLVADFASLNAQLNELQTEVAELGDPETWYVDRLTQYISLYSQLRQQFSALQQKLSSRLEDTVRMRSQWSDYNAFWNDWAAALAKQQLSIPAQTLAQVNQQLSRLDKQLQTTTTELLDFQDQIAAPLASLYAASDRLNQELEKLRQATFRKNTSSFFSAVFYHQFDGTLLTQLKSGVRAAWKIDLDFINEKGLLIVLALILLLACWGILYYYRNRFDDAEDWQFILRHPLAASSFVALVLFWLVAQPLPPLLRFVLLIWVVIAATRMAVMLVENRRQGLVLSLAALVFLVTSGFQLIALPQVLFRVYLALLALIFIPLLRQQIRISRQRRGAREGRLFRCILGLAIVVLGLSLIAQLAGYINFSTWLIQAAFETGLVILFGRMLLLISQGAVGVLLKGLIGSRRQFVARYGSQLAVRLKRLLRVVIVVVSILYLLPVWRVFTTFNEAWGELGALGISFGDSHITLQMVLMAVIAFYLAFQVSWFLQALSDSQFFAQRQVDRGVSDAIKKLLHYAIILIGFLIALGFLGMHLQNFVVLLGAFGVGIGFGLQDIVNNFLSGLILLFERPIRIGDVVQVDGEYGQVVRIGLRSTVVESFSRAELIVPNSQIISQKVTNWTHSSRGVRVILPVGVAYGSDIQKVLRILRQVAEGHEDVARDPAPQVIFMQFGSSSLDFEVRVWIANIDQRWEVQHDILLEIDRLFREQGVEIPFPQRDLHLRSVSPGVLGPQKGLAPEDPEGVPGQDEIPENGGSPASS